jgi:hypothetical protein
MTSSKKRISNLIQQEVTKSEQLNITAEAASTDASSSADTEKLQAELKQKDETIAKLEKARSGTR